MIAEDLLITAMANLPTEYDHIGAEHRALTMDTLKLEL